MVSWDRDKLYRNNFDYLMSAQNVEVKKLAYRSPNLNAYVERFVQSMQVECLDHFLILGEKHLHKTLKAYRDYYNIVIIIMESDLIKELDKQYPKAKKHQQYKAVKSYQFQFWEDSIMPIHVPLKAEIKLGSIRM